MNIYIDEAGAFVPPNHNRPHLYSIVLALVVPSANEDKLFYQFLRLRDSWPQQAVEIKGSQLNEDQTAQAMKLLAAHDVIAEYRAIDMALHPSEVIDEFKSRQAASLTEHLITADQKLVNRTTERLPSLEVRHIGALGIAG